MKLTTKQKKFVDSYIADSNATKAALEAGYSKRTARFVGAENLTKPNIKAAIDEHMNRIESDKIAKADEVLQYFTSVLRGEAEETVVVGGPMGAETVDKPPDIKTRLSAGKELLKRYPGDDEVFKAQLDKLRAEADILKAKAKREISGDTDVVNVNIVMPNNDEEQNDNE